LLGSPEVITLRKEGLAKKTVLPAKTALTGDAAWRDVDEDGVGGDDAADCLRYLVSTKARLVTQRKLRGL
jgi:hypothetical protein